MRYVLFSDADGTLLHKVGGQGTKTIDGDMLKTTLNQSMLDVIPAKAGKENAALYLVAMLGHVNKLVFA